MRSPGPLRHALHRRLQAVCAPLQTATNRIGGKGWTLHPVASHTLMAALLMAILLGAQPAARDERPFTLPVAYPPGPSTWLLGQLYGNTVFAYYQRNSLYDAGQGLHFGVDFTARCGTPVLAIGDGVVAKVDSATHGALPHNLIIDHDNGYASLYGHLLQRPELTPGERVARGQMVALTGDPDLDCSWRGHLHLEIRDAGRYKRLYNPAQLIEADWDSLALAGSYNSWFARDLEDPRRWQHIRGQPDITVWGPRLNEYPQAWPLAWRR